MKLYSVYPTCDDPDFSTPFDGSRAFGEFDECPRCNATMVVWTDSGIRNEKTRRGSLPVLAKSHLERRRHERLEEHDILVARGEAEPL